MTKNIYTLALAGAFFSLSSCSSSKGTEFDTEVTRTYTLNTCDREAKAFFAEVSHQGTDFTAFISTQNQHLIPNTEKKFKVGTHTTMKEIQTHFDGVYNTYE